MKYSDSDYTKSSVLSPNLQSDLPRTSGSEVIHSIIGYSYRREKLILYSLYSHYT